MNFTETASNMTNWYEKVTTLYKAFSCISLSFAEKIFAVGSYMIFKIFHFIDNSPSSEWMV